MIRAILCLAILFLGKKLRNSPKFAHAADPRSDSYLKLSNRPTFMPTADPKSGSYLLTLPPSFF
jgi:hypothetical protein